MTTKLRNYSLVILGGALFALTINIFLMPLGLYNGGLTGIAQLLRDFIIRYIHIPFNFDITGIITFIINVPVFLFAYRRMSRRFVINSILTITSQTVFMSIIPILKEPLIRDVFVTILVAAVVGGYGISLTFKGKGSAGGLDIIGIYRSQNHKGSVGKIYLIVNSCIYLYCFIFYDFETAVYSLIYSTLFAFTLDKFHHSNIEVSIMVFTKNPEIKHLVNNQIRRGATYWQGYGSYTDAPIEVFVSVVSQEEVASFKKLVHKHDPGAFIVISENLKVVGGFEKRLI